MQRITTCNHSFTDDAVLADTDNCDMDVPVSFSEKRSDGNCPSNYVLARNWTVDD